MKMHELKKATFYQWRGIYRRKSALVQEEDFKPEIRSFGDLRCKSTWEKAFCHLYACGVRACCLDAFAIVLCLSIPESDRLYPYRDQIFDEYLSLSGSLDLLKTGLEQLYLDPEVCTDDEREEAKGIFELVERQSSRGGIERRTAQFIQQLAGVS